MTASTILPIIMALLLLRVLWLRIKHAGTRNNSFKQLPPKEQLAVLKECLLNNPSEINLLNLKSFLEKNADSFIQLKEIDTESYRPFMKMQRELRNRKNALEEDNQLFNLQSEWIDKIIPLEFAEAKNANQDGEHETFITRTLEGIHKLYSDKAIQENLESLIPHYPKASRLLNSYRQLMDIRDSSGADDESLEKLRKVKEAWEQDLLTYEP